MAKIMITQMSYDYSDFYNPVFENVNLTMKTEWKVGLIGRNGRGKTTLLKLIKGELEPTAGRISVPLDVEYFPYDNTCEYTLTRDIIKENIGKLKSIEDTMEAIITANDESRFDEYSRLQDMYLELDGYEMESKILKEMAEMKLDKELLDRDFDTLSGGEKTRIMLLTLFLRKKQFILMDEPTNHLDDAGKDAVADYLKNKKGFIIVSHDRVFLDRVINHVLSINKRDITLEYGNYSTWKENKDRREEYEIRARERLEQEISQLERSAKANRNWATWGNLQKYDYAGNGRANGVETYMRQAKRSEGRVQENIEKKKELLQNLEEVKVLTIHQEKEEEKKCLVDIHNLSFSYEEGTRPIIEHLNLRIHTGDCLWIKGENGVGKSTLLNLINGTLETPGITYAEGIKIAYVAQDPSWKTGYVKDYFIDYGRSMQYEKFLELCDVFELPEDFLERPMQSYSSGELKKVNIARAFSEDNHLILLDEPLNYMDTYFCEQLEEAILTFSPTIVFIEHDRWFGHHIATKEHHIK